MDVRCHKCGEPWEGDTFHDVAAEKNISFDAAFKAFKAEGCKATGWTKSCEDTLPNATRHAIVELGDLLGDDVDGFASMLEDFGPMLDGLSS